MVMPEGAGGRHDDDGGVAQYVVRVNVNVKVIELDLDF